MITYKVGQRVRIIGNFYPSKKGHIGRIEGLAHTKFTYSLISLEETKLYLAFSEFEPLSALEQLAEVIEDD